MENMRKSGAEMRINMAEDFLWEIYGEAQVLCEMRGIVEYTRVYDKYHAIRKYNELLPELINVCQRYMSRDEAGGVAFFAELQAIKNMGNDIILMGDAIEARLIPLLQKSIQCYGKIQTENEEGDYSFESAASGFLTIKDLQQNIYVHSTVCPMWEAKKTAEYIFDPRKKAYCILGCGLGYLAYQLYVISDGAADIHIFEKDARMIEYARSYGVLDRIPDDRVKITIYDDLRTFFCSAQEADTGFYVQVTQIEREPADVRPLLREFYASWSTGFKFKRNNEINYWSNLRNGCKLISEFDSSQLKRDFIIVAAGPSLDSDMEFLKKNQGTMTIIAVGTVFKKLLKNNIVPDMVVILDPQESTYKQIEGVEEQAVPMLLGMIAHWKIAAAYQGEKYLIPLKNIVDLDNITEEYEEVWEGGGTVTFMAIEAAIRFRAERIFLTGVDLAYPGGMSHATETMAMSSVSSEGLLPVEGQNGETVYTTVVFNSYRHEIEAMIAETPWILYYNMSKVGAKIAGTREAADSVRCKERGEA